MATKKPTAPIHFPTTTWASLIGQVMSDSIVPRRISSLMSRMEIAGAINSSRKNDKSKNGRIEASTPVCSTDRANSRPLISR